MGAATADAPNLGYCGVSRKLKTISIKIWLGLQVANDMWFGGCCYDHTMSGYLLSNEVCKVEVKSCG